MEHWYFENGIAYECTTPDVLNLGVAPAVLLERVAQRFRENGGTVLEETRLQGVVLSEPMGGAPRSWPSLSHNHFVSGSSFMVSSWHIDILSRLPLLTITLLAVSAFVTLVLINSAISWHDVSFQQILA